MKKIALFALIVVALLSGAGLARAQEGGGDDPVVKPHPAGHDRGFNTKNAVTERVYTPLDTPCRLYDSRKTGGQLTTAVRNVPLTGCPAIPSYATSLDASLSAVNPSGSGFLRVSAHLAPAPATTALQWSNFGITTGATIPVTSSGFDVRVSAPVHLVVDVSGYYSPAIYVDVLTPSTTTFGDVYSSTAMIGGSANSLTAPGDIRITVRRSITYCDIQATAESASYTATAVLSSSTEFLVQIRNAAGNPVRAYASVVVNC